MTSRDSHKWRACSQANIIDDLLVASAGHLGVNKAISLLVFCCCYKQGCISITMNLETKHTPIHPARSPWQAPDPAYPRRPWGVSWVGKNGTQPAVTALVCANLQDSFKRNTWYIPPYYRNWNHVILVQELIPVGWYITETFRHLRNNWMTTFSTVLVRREYELIIMTNREERSLRYVTFPW